MSDIDLEYENCRFCEYDENDYVLKQCRGCKIACDLMLKHLTGAKLSEYEEAQRSKKARPS